MFAANEGVTPNDKLYVDDVFSTYLYTGNGSTQTITNGIDLAGKGGLVWEKPRSIANDHYLTTGFGNFLRSNTTGAQSNTGSSTYTFNSTGYVANSWITGLTVASWTFRKQPKFFDVVTYTGNGSNFRSLSHSLAGQVGCIFVKATSTTKSWRVWHRAFTDAYSNNYLELNTTAAVNTATFIWGGQLPTNTTFGVGDEANLNGVTYVAYLFAHDAGGFGASGSDNVISCGSFSGAGTAVTLGWEPQWLLMKQTSTTGDWFIVDNMRGWPVGSSNDQTLFPNTSAAEGAFNIADITSTGFVNGGNSGTLIYLAIRRPNKPPTSGTQVYNAIARTGTGAAATLNVGFPADLAIVDGRTKAANTTSANWEDRLRGSNLFIESASTSIERTAAGSVSFDSMVGVNLGSDSGIWGFNRSNETYINWLFRRAPGVFDEFCDTGTGSNKTVNHNLGVAPELWLRKGRSGATEWVWGSSLLANTEKIVMPSPNGKVTDATAWNSTYPTASLFSVGTAATTNTNAATYVTYLWATLAGVSKVFTYTGNGSSQTINCGFSAGARFVMIIRVTASTAQDIFIWDSARGIVAGNDPRLSLNTTAAEVTTLDSVDTDASGFIVNTDSSNINVNGAVYIGLAYS